MARVQLHAEADKEYQGNETARQQNEIFQIIINKHGNYKSLLRTVHGQAGPFYRCKKCNKGLKNYLAVALTHTMRCYNNAKSDSCCVCGFKLFDETNNHLLPLTRHFGASNMCSDFYVASLAKTNIEDKYVSSNFLNESLIGKTFAIITSKEDDYLTDSD